MKKLILILLIIASCSKESEQEDVYGCECEFVNFYAVGFGANRYASLRPCELPNGITVENAYEKMSFKEAMIFSEKQGCTTK